jgi:hypothetical protein
MTFSMISAMPRVARTVIVFAVLLGAIVGWMATPGTRVRQEEGADDLILVHLPLLVVVGDHEDGALVDHLVPELVRRHDLVQRLLERDAFELDAEGRRPEVALEGDVDAGGVADEVEDVLRARVVELEDQRLAGGGIEQRRLRLAARLLPHLLDGRLRP